METKEEAADQNLICSLCNKNCLDSNIFVLHLEDVHSIFFDHDLMISLGTFDEVSRTALKILVENTNMKQYEKSISSINSRTVCCAFCHGTIKYTNIENHMKEHHGAVSEINFHVAICFIDEEQKDAIKSITSSNEALSQEDTYESTAKRKVEHTDILDHHKALKVVKLDFKEALQFDCEKCEHCFDNSAQLKIHINLMHGEGYLKPKAEIPDENRLKLIKYRNPEGILVSNDLADYTKTQCNLCWEIKPLTSLRGHTKGAHGMTISEYKELFGEKLEYEEKVLHKCALCGEIILLDNDYVATHVRKHRGITHKQYNQFYMVDSRQKENGCKSSKEQKMKVNPEGVLMSPRRYPDLRMFLIEQRKKRQQKVFTRI